MRGLLLVVASFIVTILTWGFYGPMLHEGQAAMSSVPGQLARLRPFVSVGFAYFAIGVLVPAVLLFTRGEQGGWTLRGIIMSLLAGVLGAMGALGIVMAFTFGGRPSYVMPLVFGGAPVVNSFLTIYFAKRVKAIGPIFMAGLVMVLLGAITVLVFKPAPPAVTDAPVVAEAADAEVVAQEQPPTAEAGLFSGQWLFQLLSIATVVLCWGAYGPVLHRGQAAMQGSGLRPLLCVGLAYFAIAVVVPNVLLSGGMAEASTYTFSGTAWSLAAGTAGAVGALGLIMAFHFGGRPIYVMPLVFGGAPVVNTFATLFAQGELSQVNPMFLAGLILVIAGAVMTLLFAPKGPPSEKNTTKEEPTPPETEEPKESESVAEEK